MPGTEGGDNFFISKFPGSGPSKAYSGPVQKRCDRAGPVQKRCDLFNLSVPNDRRFSNAPINAVSPSILELSGVITPKIKLIDTGKSGKTSAFDCFRQPKMIFWALFIESWKSTGPGPDGSDLRQRLPPRRFGLKAAIRGG